MNITSTGLISNEQTSFINHTRNLRQTYKAISQTALNLIAQILVGGNSAPLRHPIEVLKLASTIFWLSANRFSINQLAARHSSRALIDKCTSCSDYYGISRRNAHRPTSKLPPAEIRPPALLFSSYYLRFSWHYFRTEIQLQLCHSGLKQYKAPPTTRTK